ncbi:MAG: T9SS type A sorting domain-containing protein [bacterium]
MEASKSTNSGSSWTRYPLTTTTGYAYTIEIDPVNSNIVYIGGDGGIYKTINAGTSWSGASTGITGIVYDMAINPDNTSVLYAGTANGMYKTTDSGITWSYTGCSNVRSIIIDPMESNTIYAGTTTGVYKSTSGGSSWAVINNGLDDTYVTCLGIHPSCYLFAGTESAGMYRWDLNIGIGEFNTEHLPQEISISPNPSKTRMTISYQLSQATLVNLCVYDIQGRLVKVLVNSTHNAGSYNAIWQGSDNNNNDVAAGVYLCRFSTDYGTHIEKLVFLR